MQTERIPMLLAVVLSAASASAHSRGSSEPNFAEHSWSVADGLAHERVNCVMQDHKGWIWLGTWEGVSRFDGAKFVTYSTREGLPNPFVNSIVEDESRRIWVTTNGGGIARLLDDPAQRATGAKERFKRYRLGPSSEDNTVDVLFVDGTRLWCAAETGLYRAELIDGAPRAFECALPMPRASWVPTTVRDHAGRTWLANDVDLVGVDGEHVERIAIPSGGTESNVVGLAIDGDGRLLVATHTSLLACTRGKNGETTWSERALPAPVAAIHTLLLDRDQAAWLGTQSGLMRMAPDGSSTRWLRDEVVYALTQDRAGNVWAGTWSSGVHLLAPSAVRSWTTADGLPDRSIAQVVPARDGHIVGTTGRGTFEVRDGAVRVLPGSGIERFAHVGMSIGQSADGGWWLGNEEGLWSAPGPELDFTRLKLLAFEPGRAATNVFGRILVSTTTHDVLFGGGDGRLYAFDSAAPNATCRSIAPDDSAFLTAARELSFATDGTLWLAPYTGLYRRRNGVFEDVSQVFGASIVQPRCVHEDKRGRVWLGTRNDGLWRIDDPSADRPSPVNVLGREDLGTGAVWSICEDPRGRLWLASGHGLVRFDADSHEITAFTTRDGLAGDIVSHCACDADGRVWAATSNGLSVVDSALDPPPVTPPPVFITRLRIAGSEVSVPETGITHVPALELGPDQNDVEIAFASPAYGCEGPMRWQYRLGSDVEWCAPGDEAQVRYARLMPGRYAFEVRSVTSTGNVSAETAGFALTIFPPMWQRPWFVGIALALLAFLGWLLHRARLRRALALERIRSQIASDLHDDLGAGLAQIAILSEVARRDGAAHGHLAEIAGLARTMRESVGEIVWAIDPRKDQADELVRRMRQTACNLLESEGVDVELRAPPEAVLERVGLAPDQRRHLLLVVKEALTNVARHARASRVVIELVLEGNTLRLAIEDDGRGFDKAAETTGNGLRSFERRANALGARLSIRSNPGERTRIELSMPISRLHVHAVAREDGGR